MAVTQTLLTSGLSTVTPHTVATTASISPTANRLVLLDIFTNHVTAGDAADPTVSGGGLTWTRVTSVNTTAAGCNLSRWRALSASPGTGTVSITHPSGSFCAWSISEFAGIDTGGTNGANAIVQSATNSNITGSANTVTATLAAFASANNGAASAHGFFNVTPLRTASPDTGWTETAEQGSVFATSFVGALETQWRSSNDTTALATWSGTGGVFALTSELKAGLNAYTLAANGGTFSLSGTAAIPKAARRLAAAGGTYALTGAAASLERGRTLAADGATYTLTGGAAALEVARTLSAAGGTFVFTGGAATLTTDRALSAAGGTYSLTGGDATLTYGALDALTLSAEGTTYTLTGGDAALTLDRTLDAQGSVYSLTGGAAGLRVGRTALDAQGASYSLTGGAATLTTERLLSAEGAAYSLSGGDATLTHTVPGLLVAEGATYTLTGGDATLTYASNQRAGGLSSRVAIEHRKRVWYFDTEEEAEEWLRAQQPIQEKLAAKTARKAIKRAMSAPLVEAQKPEIRVVSGSPKLEAVVQMRKALLDRKFEDVLKSLEDDEDDEIATLLMLL